MKQVFLNVLLLAAACGGAKSASKAGGDDPISKCEAGDGKACSDLGNQHSRGDKPNAPLAVSYLRKACDLKYWPACSDLAYQHSMGRGVPRDEVQAGKLWDLACGHDVGRACFARAVAYNDFLKSCDMAFNPPDHKKPAACKDGQFVAATKMLEVMKKACRLADEDACKIMAEYDKKPGLVRFLDDPDALEPFWLFPGPDAKASDYVEED